MKILAAQNRSIVLLAALAILLSLCVPDYFAWVRLKPEVSATNLISSKNDYESHEVYFYRSTVDRVEGGKGHLLPVYDLQDPGFFALVGELAMRAGATTLYPLEILSLVLFNVAAFLFFGWTLLLFNDVLVAFASTVFLTLSQFFLFFPGLPHTFPYEFIFFNLTMLLYVGFLKTDRKDLLTAALLAMFMTCMNYWFYYLSSWIIMIGLWWQYRGRPRIRDIAMLSTPPIAAVALTVSLIMLDFGVAGALKRIADIAAARTVDARLPGGQWFPDQHFLHAGDWSNYPYIVRIRLEWAFNIDPLFWFMSAAACTLLLLWHRNRERAVSALILLAGGSAWYAIMIQHTTIHHFVGQYAFMAICPIAGLIVGEAIRAIYGAWMWIGSSPRLVSWPRAIISAFLLFTAWETALHFEMRTRGLLQESLGLARQAETKYAGAVQAICRVKGVVTLSDLQNSSKAFGFDWRPDLIAGTNRMPNCAEVR
jgi:hypothetical protein